MNTKLIYIFLFIAFVASCKYLPDFQTKDSESLEPVVAKVGDVELFLSDIQSVVPKGLSVKDSIVFIKGYVNSWAKKQLLLQKAEENISEVNSKQIENLVKEYRHSLYVNGYKERLIKQQLDTVISEEEIKSYYSIHKENFKLNEDVLQLKYIYFGRDFLDKKEVVKRFKSDKEEDLEELELHTLNFKDYRLRDSTWISYQELLTKIPPFVNESKKNVLKKSKFLQTEDSLGVYLVAVNKVLRRNQTAPVSYISPKIKQLILHKRKSNLIRKIEKTLINDAIKNENFTEY